MQKVFVIEIGKISPFRQLLRQLFPKTSESMASF